MAESELIEVVQLPNGEEMRKFRADDGNVSYRRSDGTYLSPEVGEALERNASRTSDDYAGVQAEFKVEPRTENDRQQLVETRYPEIDEVRGLHPDKPKRANNKYEQNVIAWMNNDTLVNQVENDPLAQSPQERDELLEARARQITDDIRSVDNEREAMQVLRSYNIY